MFGYVITAFAGIFWLFRLIVALMYSTEAGFAIVPMNMNFEVVLLFITFICVILIGKRNMIGAVIYLIAQCSYFGIDAYKTLVAISNGQASDYLSLFISIIAIVIPILAIMDIGLSSGKKSSFGNRKTDWFYGTTDYDRNLDERADKNQYKF